MESIWTVGELLAWVIGYLGKHGIEEPRLEAEVLLAFAMGTSRLRLYTDFDRPAGSEEREVLKNLLRRRIKGEPVAYLVGQREFMSLPFKVGPGVLIPRPETEILVERAVDIVRERGFTCIADVGTGSGAIAVSLAYYTSGTQVWAVDISEDALALARCNAEANRVGERIRLVKGDLLGAEGLPERFDLIAANLPYVAEEWKEEVSLEVRTYEPGLALWGGADGLDLYRRLIPQACRALAPGGCLLGEIDPRQKEAIAGLLHGFAGISFHKDLAGKIRVFEAWKEQE